MSLSNQLAALDKQSEAEHSAEELAAMKGATEALRRSGILGHVARVGAIAPDFMLTDEAGTGWSLSQLRQSGPVVLSFYRGVWCPYCNADLQALQEVLPEIEAKGAALLTISPQTRPNSRKTKRQNGLTFPILSDPGNEIAAAYGLRFTLDAAVQVLYRGWGLALPDFNGDETWTLPMPARFIVRTDGLIAYAESDPDYTKRPDPSVLLDVLQQL